MPNATPVAAKCQQLLSERLQAEARIVYDAYDDSVVISAIVLSLAKHSEPFMAKRESLKDQLKKAAKKRAVRNGQSPALANGLTGLDGAAHSQGEGVASSVTDRGAASEVGSPSGRSATVRCLDIIVGALLDLDKQRDDLNDRALMVGLKSVLRGYAGTDSGSAAVYRAVVDVKKSRDIQPRPFRAAIDQLLEIVMAYGADRETPRAALTYLHSITS